MTKHRRNVDNNAMQSQLARHLCYWAGYSHLGDQCSFFGERKRSNEGSAKGPLPLERRDRQRWRQHQLVLLVAGAVLVANAVPLRRHDRPIDGSRSTNVRWSSTLKVGRLVLQSHKKDNHGVGSPATFPYVTGPIWRMILYRLLNLERSLSARPITRIRPRTNTRSPNCRCCSRPVGGTSRLVW